MLTSLDLYPQPDDKRTVLLDAFRGKHASELPTPSFVVKKSVMENNCLKMLQRVSDLDVDFRAHVKTVKTYPGLRNQMGYDLPAEVSHKRDRVLVSTLCEAWEIVRGHDTNGEVVVKDLLYGLPGVTDQYLEPLDAISNKIETVRLMVDNVQHLENVKRYNLRTKRSKKWSIFVKIDAGTNRAGIPVDDPKNLSDFLAAALSEEYSDHIELFGFYCHLGHSYAADTIGKAEKHLVDEIRFVSKATDILKALKPDYLSSHKLTVSIGATPTIHSFDNYLYKKQEPELDALVAAEIAKIKSQNISLEIHAGNYPICDLQQLATGCIDESCISSYVLSQVISQYPGRRNDLGEMLMSTGVISLTKEVSAIKGFGALRYFGSQDYGEWYVDRMSQEHGILAPRDATKAQMIPIGTKVKVLPQHSCITINGFSHLFILDDDENVVDIWIPWRGY